MDKNSYLFSEIIFGLRDEYVKNQKLLNELKKYINILNENIVDLDLYLAKDIKNLNIIKLDISKKQTKILEMINYASLEVLGGIPQYIELSYVLKKEKNGYFFDLDGKKFLKEPLKYNIEITDQKAFDEIVKCVSSSKLANLENLCIFLNPFQTIFADNKEVSMYVDFSMISSLICSNLSYNSKADTIFTNLDCRNNKDLLIKLLNTKIPRYSLPLEYQKIIDENIKKYGDLSFDERWIKGFIGRRNELDIEVSNNNVALTKKRTLKFYE